MTLPITYADGNTTHGTDVDTWTAVINSLTAFITPPSATLVAGFTTTVTSGSLLTLTVSSTSMQVLTATTAQTVKLPTTSVLAGAAWIISNQSSATATVESSGANTVTTVAAGDTAVFLANKATPTAAADWSYTICDVFAAFATTATATGTTTLVTTSPQVQIFTGTAIQTVTMPTTSVPMGAQWLIINQSTLAVTVQSSGSNTVVVLAAGTSAVLTAVVDTPTTAANWGAQYGGVAVASGTVLTGPAVSGFIAAPPAQTATLTSPAAVTAATLTKVMSSNVIPASTMAVGTTFRIHTWGTQLNTCSMSYTVHIGTSGTTADVGVCTAANVVGAALGNFLEAAITIRTTGGSGSCMASGALAGSAAGGVSTQVTTQAVNTTVANYVTVGTACSKSTNSVQTCVISWAAA